MAQLYVNPTSGTDTAPGTQSAPFKTITRALQSVSAGTTVKLAPGTYNTASGETFPIVIPVDVILSGDESVKGKGTQITGSGKHNSPSFGMQNVTLRPDSRSQLRGVSVTNSDTRGTGLWIENTDPTIANCTFTECKREGIFSTGSAKAIVTDCMFVMNAANGISIVRESKGEFRKNTLQNTGFGLSIGDNAAPLIVDNKIFENRSGIVLSRNARPVLRGNTVERNTESGLVVLETSLPNIGSPQEPGGNIFRDNGEADVQNVTNPPVTLISVGNQLNPARLQGPIELLSNEVPPAVTPPIATNPPPVVPPVITPPIITTPPIVTPPKVTPPPVDPNQETPFPDPITPPIGKPTDIQSHWAQAFIQALVDRSFISGFPDGSFKPDAILTRAQFAAILAKSFDLPAKRQPIPFNDVPSNFWGADAINKATAMGFISGYPDGTFRPGQNLTRVQAMVALVSGLGLTGGQLSILGTYSDRTGIPSYAVEAVSTATQKRMVVNYPTPKQLNPNRDMTRAEFAAILYQSLVTINRGTPIASIYIVEPDNTQVRFTDLDLHWAKDFILSMAMQDYVRGYSDGSFKPDAPITRAQFAAIAARAINPSPARSSVVFSDVPSNHWAKSAIDQVYSANFLNSDATGKFNPDQKMTRLQLVQALSSGLSLSGGNLSVLDKLSDRASIPSAAQITVADAIQNRVVVNVPDVNKFTPNRDATRAEVVAMINQALVRTGRSIAVSSIYIVA